MKKIFFLLLIAVWALAAEEYQPYSEWVKELTALKKEFSGLVRMATYGQSFQGRDLWAVQIGDETKPGVLIVGNISGCKIDATYQAVKLIGQIAGRYKDFNRFSFWFIPNPNPDVYEAYFAKKGRSFKPVNNNPFNDDADIYTDEDGTEDLNGDGLISQMRKKEIGGEYLEDSANPGLMLKADKINGQRGIYQIYREGLDDDGDGLFNEDEIGGVELNKNFPHQFQYFKKNSGLFPASEKEVRALLDFVYKKENIFIAFILDEANNLMKLPVTTDQPKLAAAKFKIPERAGKFLGIDISVEYTIEEIREMIEPFTRGMKITDEMIASFFGFGARLNYQDQDMKYMERFAKDYKDLLKKMGISDSRQYQGEENGSISQWLYFQYGIPAIALDSFTLPVEKEEKGEKSGLSVEKLKSMSSDDFLKLPKEEIEGFLKANHAPAQFNADMVINLVKSGQITPAKMAEYLEKNLPQKQEGDQKSEYLDLFRWLKKNGGDKSILKWQPFNHPQLGPVEIGGFEPYSGIVPPISLLAEMLRLNGEFMTAMLDKVPRLQIKEKKVKKLGDDVYQIEFHVVNEGYLPLNFEQGVVNQRQYPVLVKIDLNGNTLVSGKKIERIENLEGMGGFQKFTIVVRTSKSRTLTISVESRKYGVLKEALELK